MGKQWFKVSILCKPIISLAIVVLRFHIILHTLHLESKFLFKLHFIKGLMLMVTASISNVLIVLCFNMV
jgi:hypothetical protein